MIVCYPKPFNFIPHIPIQSHLLPLHHPCQLLSHHYSLPLTHRRLHPNIINLKHRIHNLPPLNPRTLYQYIQPILPLPLRIPNAIIPKRPPGHRSKFLKLFTKRRGFETRNATFEIREEGETAGLRGQRLELAGVEGEGVGGAIAVGYWLGEAEDGAREDIRLLAEEDKGADW